MAIVGRAVPWILQSKNREKARERLYKSVCAPLTKRDSFGSTGVEGHENEKRGMLLLFPSKGWFLNQPFFVSETYNETRVSESNQTN